MVDTNQTKCYNNTLEIPCSDIGEDFYGQDAQYTKNELSYKVNGDGSISDTVTGLMWMQSDSGEGMNWEESLSYTENKNEANEQDYPYYWTCTTHLLWNTNRGGVSAMYMSFGNPMGYLENEWTDVHGAGAKRSNPKTGDPTEYPNGFKPQGDAIRINN